MRVYLRHVRKLQYCRRGAASFFARHGLSWGDFVMNGIEAERLEATGDAMAIKAVEIARAERGR